MDQTPQTVGESSLTDRFERIRESMWGAPGFQRRNSTIVTPGSSLLPQGSWIVETIRTDDSVAIFIQTIDREGGQRIIIPRKVCEAIYKHHDHIMKVRRKVRSKHGAETRMKRSIVGLGFNTGDDESP